MLQTKQRGTSVRAHAIKSLANSNTAKKEHSDQDTTNI